MKNKNSSHPFRLTAVSVLSKMYLDATLTCTVKMHAKHMVIPLSIVIFSHISHQSSCNIQIYVKFHESLINSSTACPEASLFFIVCLIAYAAHE